MLRLMLLYLLACGCLHLWGQRRVVVLDAQSHIPVVGVSVSTHGTSVLTDRGGVAFLQEPGDTITFIHRYYLSEKLRQYELRDTIFLERNEQIKTIELPEVTINELSPQLKGLIHFWIKDAVAQGAAEAPRGVANFDFAKMLDRRGRRDQRHLAQAKEILRKWDKKK